MRFLSLSVLAPLAATFSFVGTAGLGEVEPVNFAVWSTATTGTLEGLSFSVVGGREGAGLGNEDMSTASYVPAGGVNQQISETYATDTLTVSFEAPVTNPAFYFKYLRGPFGPTRYTLSSVGGSCVWTIKSGLPDARLSGNALTPSRDTYNDGVVLCTGTVTSLTIVPALPTSGPYGGWQVFTLATLPNGGPPPPPEPVDRTRQVITWPVTTSHWNIDSPVRLAAASTTGDGTLSYAVADAGSARCVLGGSSGRSLSFEGAGTCTVRVTASATADFFAGLLTRVITIREARAPGEVRRLRVFSESGGRVELQWRAPRDPGTHAIDGYRVKMRLRGASESQVIDVDPGSTGAVVRGLEPGSYRMSVRAVSAAGTGPKSAIRVAVGD